MDKKKVLKIALVIVVLIIVLVVLLMLRNFMILRSIQKKIANYSASTNYSVHSVNNITDENNEESKSVVDYYRKENKAVRIVERTNNDGTITMSTYYDGEKTNTFFDGEDFKFVRLNSEDAISNFEEIQNGLEKESIWETLKLSFEIKIEKVECNRKECYKITFDEIENNEFYIEKETGLRVREIVNSIVDNDYMMKNDILVEYQFDNVSDNVFIEPDITEYPLEEDVMN